MSTRSVEQRTRLARGIEDFGSGPLLVHNDVFGVLGLIENRSTPGAILDEHTECLDQLFGERAIYFPTFNYDFPVRKVYDVANDPAQVGRLSEHLRTLNCMWRSAVPIFNICGRLPAPIAEPQPNERTQIDPFGADSIFGHLYHEHGTVLFYGAPFNSFTGIHFVERASGGPLYRYDKLFRGTVRLMSGQNAETELNYHVRPMGKNIDYDFQAVLSAAIGQGVGRNLSGPGASLIALDFRGTTDLLLDRLRDDPFALLTKPNRDSWKAEVDRIGRRVEISDYEEVTS